LELLAREAAAPVTSMAPGTTGYLGGRPAVQSVARLFSFLVPRGDVPASVDFGGQRHAVAIPEGAVPETAAAAPPSIPSPAPTGPTVAVPLIALAHGRSGDKGDSANIAIIARRPEFLPALRAALTEAAVADYFRHLKPGRVRRYDVPGVQALNFVLEAALGGGGAASLRNDPQGKAFAQMLLDLAVPVPAELAARYGLTARSET